MADNANNRRQKAAEARTAAQAGEKRRERTVRIVGAAVVIVIVGAIIALALVARGSSSDSSASGGTQPDPGAAIPTSVLAAGDAHEFGVPYGTGAATVPVLQIWEDFQCPACAAVEQANGKGIEQLAADGKIQLIWRPTTFLDRNLKNDASERAVAAWGCAIDAGKAVEYHNVVYANQPANEGDGYTDEALLGFAEQAGITGDGLTTFTQCVADGTYRVWAANSTNAFYNSGAQGTPTAVLDNAEITTDVLIDQAKLEAAVAAATK